MPVVAFPSNKTLNETTAPNKKFGPAGERSKLRPTPVTLVLDAALAR